MKDLFLHACHLLKFFLKITNSTSNHNYYYLRDLSYFAHIFCMFNHFCMIKIYSVYFFNKILTMFYMLFLSSIISKDSYDVYFKRILLQHFQHNQQRMQALFVKIYHEYYLVYKFIPLISTCLSSLSFLRYFLRVIFVKAMFFIHQLCFSRLHLFKLSKHQHFQFISNHSF